eukprot:TRINITY_DN2146_c2_g1_i2.p1 TRINITY_DN2146_c2_g1~~TRINITY_DN2146_c2_g1_i2.p1  ORF type:complete len:628 (-),score=227.82 TRINITY_DN2146_c2_g1_i2:30-1913(-)
MTGVSGLSKYDLEKISLLKSNLEKMNCKVELAFINDKLCISISDNNKSYCVHLDYNRAREGFRSNSNLVSDFGMILQLLSIAKWNGTLNQYGLLLCGKIDGLLPTTVEYQLSEVISELERRLRAIETELTSTKFELTAAYTRIEKLEGQLKDMNREKKERDGFPFSPPHGKSKTSKAPSPPSAGNSFRFTPPNQSSSSAGTPPTFVPDFTKKESGSAFQFSDQWKEYLNKASTASEKNESVPTFNWVPPSVPTPSFGQNDPLKGDGVNKGNPFPFTAPVYAKKNESAFGSSFPYSEKKENVNTFDFATFSSTLFGSSEAKTKKNTGEKKESSEEAQNFKFFEERFRTFDFGIPSKSTSEKKEPAVNVKKQEKKEEEKEEKKEEEKKEKTEEEEEEKEEMKDEDMKENDGNKANAKEKEEKKEEEKEKEPPPTTEYIFERTSTEYSWVPPPKEKKSPKQPNKTSHNIPKETNKPSPKKEPQNDATKEQRDLITKVERAKDYYHVLGCGRNETKEDLKEKFKKMALLLHPDKNQARGAEDAFKKVRQAYETLSDPAKKREYDESIPLKANTWTKNNNSHHKSDYYKERADNAFKDFFGGSSKFYTRPPYCEKCGDYGHYASKCHAKYTR